MNKNLLLGGLVIFAVLGGILYFVQSSNSITSSPEIKKEEVMVKKGTNTTSQSDFSGKVLAGKSSPYIEFNKADYDKALAEGKIIFLDFYANWCPICRAEFPELYAGFDALTTDKVVGFRVNYNDSDTDADEKALAKQFDITYQHQKRIIKDGKVVLESADSWDKERVVREINGLL